MAFGGGPDSDARVPVIGSAVGVFGSTVVGVFGSTAVVSSPVVGVFGATAVVISSVLVKAVPGARCSPSEWGDLYRGRIRAMG